MHDSQRFRPLGSVLGAAVLLLSWTATASSQRYANDPVEDLRQALKIGVIDSTGNPDELRFRRENLTKLIAKLRGPGDLRRALMLQEWLDEDQDEKVREIDSKLRGEVADKFKQALHDFMQHGDAAGRMAAAGMLAEMGTEVKTPSRTGADIKSSGTKFGVASSLAPDLVKLTGDPNLRVREAAARALGLVNPDPKVAVPPLSKLLKADEDFLRRAAAAGLRNLIQQIIPIITGKGKSVTGVEVQPVQVVEIGELVVPAAAKGLTDRDASVRRTCAQAIQLAAVALGDVIQSPATGQFPPKGRKVSAEEAKNINETRTQVDTDRRRFQPLLQAFHDQAPALAKALGDSDALVRLQVCRALEDIANARQRIVKLIESVPEEPKAIEKLPPPGAAPEEPIRPAADEAPKAPKTPVPADSLGEGLRVTLPELAVALRDPDVRVRRAALDVLELLGPRAAPAGPAIIGALGDPDLFVRWAAARALGKTGGAPADAGIAALAHLLYDPDLDLRVTVAGVLERFGAAASAAVPSLARAAGSGDAEIRMAAMRALESIGREAREAIPVIAEGLSHSDARVRRTAAEVLGQFGTLARSAIPALREALNDDDPEVRRAASDALLSIEPVPATEK
jgi:HEAT repeat protein